MLNALIGFLGLALLVFPGWWIARAARLRVPVLLGVLGGALAAVTLVLLLQLTGRRLVAANFAVGWAAWTLAAVLLSRRFARAAPASVPAAEPTRAKVLWPWAIALPTLAAVSFRAFARPLFGTDTPFRWSFLAEQMWGRETLSFYPPVTPAGLEVYAWPDGIPPLVSSIYFGLYCLAGKVEPAVTGPVAAFQFVLLLVATGALARRTFSAAAESWAIALLGVTPLAAWATAMGQETGFMALGVVGLFLYLPRDRGEETLPTMLAVGATLAVTALAREYGWAFTAIGLGLCWLRRLSPRGLATAAAVVAVVAMPWYVRNWLLSGNPFFNLGTGGLFPVNEAHAALMAVYQRHLAFTRQVAEGGFLDFANVLVVLAAGVAGAWSYFRSVKSIVFAAVVGIALWIISVGYTAAGFTAAMRVLNPVLALAAVLGGAWLAAKTPTRSRQHFTLALLAVVGLDAAIRTLNLPLLPYDRPPSAWPNVDVPPADYQARRRASFQDVAQRVGSGRLLALGVNNVMTRLGVASVPPWSPDVAFLFDPKADPAAAWPRLRELGFTHVLISKSDMNREYLTTSPVFRAATGRELPPVITNDEFVLFAILPP
jgi:hypothetical protein